MIALDTNILIGILVSSHESHSTISTQLKKLKATLVTTHTNVGECLRLLTHPKVFLKPLNMKRALETLSQFIEAYGVEILEESTSWWLDLGDLISDIPDLRGNGVFDARIALCLKYNGVREIWTMDSDFRKYPFLKVIREV